MASGSFWNKIYDSKEGSHGQLASHLRFIQTQIKDNHTYQSEREKSLEELFTLKKYSEVVDSKSCLNNYAPEIITLNKDFKNESRKWRSSVTLNHLKKYEAESKGKDNVDNDYERKLQVELSQLAKVLRRSSPMEVDCLESGASSQIPENSNDINFDIDCDQILGSQNKNESLVQKTLGLNSGERQFESNASLIENFLPKKRKIYDESTRIAVSKHELKTSKENENPAQSKVGRRPYPWEIQQKSSGSPTFSSFRTASHQMELDDYKKNGLAKSQRKCLGTSRNIKGKFVLPVKSDEEQGSYGGNNSSQSSNELNGGLLMEIMKNEKMKNIDQKMAEMILNEIIDNGAPVTWDDIAGLQTAKSTLQEVVVWPMLRPDIFTGLRGPPKGILLFGPPGTGKTMIGKCIANQSRATFFSISASSLTSKWVGEGEKMVRAMFAVAKCLQPSVIFIDEIDSLLTQRSDTEHESSRRIKTEFFVQLEGTASGEGERILVVGATNRPQELDEAARRRFVKRLYIPLPESEARKKIVENLLSNQNHRLSSGQMHEVSETAQGYSGADMANLCREAAMGPIRSIDLNEIEKIAIDQVRPINFHDFSEAFRSIRASVSSRDLELYEEWNRKYGICVKS